MANFPETRISLILKLAASENVQAWQEFSAIYAPVLLNLARRKGLQPSDAEDVTQEILFGVARAVDRFQPDGDTAKFRTWLSRIARNRIAEFYHRREVRPPIGQLPEDPLEQPTLGEADAEAMRQELQASLLRVAADRVRQRVASKTWQAFEATTVAAKPTSESAKELAMSVGAIYVARCRVLKMLRDEVQQLENSYAPDSSPELQTGQSGPDCDSVRRNPLS